MVYRLSEVVGDKAGVGVYGGGEAFLQVVKADGSGDGDVKALHEAAHGDEDGFICQGDQFLGGAVFFVSETQGDGLIEGDILEGKSVGIQMGDVNFAAFFFKLLNAL